MPKEVIYLYIKIFTIIGFSILILSAAFIFSKDLIFYQKIIIYFQIVFYLFSIILYITKSFIYPLLEIKNAFKKINSGIFNFQIYQKYKDKFFESFVSDFNKVLLSLKQFKEQQNLLSKVKSDFVSMAAHQFRRPVAEIRWILKMFLDGELGKLEKKQIELLNRVYRNNETINLLIDDLLNLAKIEDGGGYYFSLQKIEPIIENVISDLEFLAKSKQLELIFEKSKEIPPIKLDESKIKLVIFNLIDNAIKYSYNQNKILISLNKEDNFIKVSVKDFGIGISKNEQRYIFEKFFRGSNASKIASSGTGLGLYIVRTIIEQHGGEVGLISEENKGSVFWFKLPIR